MSAIETVKTLITALQSGDMETAANVMADDFLLRGWDTQPLDKGQFLTMQSRLLAAIPDYTYNLSDVQEGEQGNEVTAFISITGTHTQTLDLPLQDFVPIAPTGIAFVLPQVRTHYKLANNKVREMTIEEVPGGGLRGLLQQVGGEVPVYPGLASISPGELGLFETTTPHPIRGEQKDTPD